MREDLDRNSHRLKAVLGEEGMRRDILNGAPDEEKAVKAFVNQNQESALKTKPKVGFVLLLKPCSTAQRDL
jgi:hypothetical protein